ncbi:MAG TPA: hypothetical protein VHO26_12400 [Propionibacteriaceae bacterium]|nr:hypothetical protein [Propionibacteriaceae bacterium]
MADRAPRAGGAEVGRGATLKLQAPTHGSVDSLVLLDEVTIEGAEKGRNIINPYDIAIATTATPSLGKNACTLVRGK